MATPSAATRAGSRRHRSAPVSESRYDRRLSEILSHATEVFCKKGYEGASMRDLSRESGMSLAGLYYYFESKERLLYLIQKHTFTHHCAAIERPAGGGQRSGRAYSGFHPQPPRIFSRQPGGDEGALTRGRSFEKRRSVQKWPRSNANTIESASDCWIS